MRLILRWSLQGCAISGISRISICIGLGFIVLFLVWQAIHNENNETYTCVIQPDQVVINTYRDDEIVRSFAIKEATYTEWRRGMLEPVTRSPRQMFKDSLPSKIKGYRSLVLYADGEIMLYDVHVSRECYDAF